MRDFLLSYDSVYLRPKHSELESRSQADTSVDFLGERWKLPVVPANMEDVVGIDNAKFLAQNGYFYIMHRFGDINKRVGELDKYNMSISLGVNEEDKNFLEEFVFTPMYITLDVAHAHHKKVEDMIEFLHYTYRGETYDNRPKFIVGNVATADGYKFLVDQGVDAVKVGIGGGSICSTKYKTGFHLPTLQSVYECANTGLDVPIIADGGARHFGDVAKALTFGASMVMSGKFFAGCIDSPAKIVGGRKLYRGSTSYEAKGKNVHVEGISLEIEEGCTYAERLLEIRQALQSAISYAGGNDLSAFNLVEWERCL